MYKFRGNLGVKLTAIILFTVFAVTSVLSGIAIVFSAVNGVYFDKGERLRADIIGEAVYSKVTKIAPYIEIEVDGEGRAVVQDIPEYLLSKDENFAYAVIDIESGEAIYESKSVAEPKYSKGVVIDAPVPEENYKVVFDDYTSAMEYAKKYALDHPDSNNFSIRVENVGGSEHYVFYDISREGGRKHYLVKGMVDGTLPLTGEISSAGTFVDFMCENRYTLVWCCIGSVVLVLVLFVFLMCSAGRKSGVEGVYLCWSDKIPFDIVLGILAFLACLTFAILSDFGNTLHLFIAIAAAAICWLVILMCNLVSFAARAKAGDWWKNTVIYMVLRLVFRLAKRLFGFIFHAFSAVPLIWRGLLLWLLYSFCEMIVLVMTSPVSISEHTVVAYALLKLITTVIIAVLLSQLHTLAQAGERLSQGEVNCDIDKRYMFGAVKRHAENLESIGDGISLAVERQTRSERMKAELITNVSHDIKTPLTSIINYVDLLKKEEIESEKARGYIEVIDRQSTRLKKLTEDLVEASKAQSGSIAVRAEPCDIGVLLSQGFGEYEERMTEKGLFPQLSAEGGNMAMLDGKLLWRVFDNLFGNICKYAMPGTRVYVSEYKRGDRVIVIFRNITNIPIDVSAEELTERFVRADKSRSSEGSGLGLSISKSLTELMNGSFEVTVDGDLFKVKIEFDVHKE